MRVVRRAHFLPGRIMALLALPTGARRARRQTFWITREALSALRQFRSSSVRGRLLLDPLDLASRATTIEADAVAVIASLARFGLQNPVAAPRPELAVFGARAVGPGVHAVVAFLMAGLHDAVAAGWPGLAIRSAGTVRAGVHPVVARLVRHLDQCIAAMGAGNTFRRAAIVGGIAVGRPVVTSFTRGHDLVAALRGAGAGGKVEARQGELEGRALGLAFGLEHVDFVHLAGGEPIRRTGGSVQRHRAGERRMPAA